MSASLNNPPAPPATSSVISAEVLAGEGLYLAAAAKLFPRHRRGRPVSPSTVFRWIAHGVRLDSTRRVHLEATRIAGRWVTTRGAIKRFLDRQGPQPLTSTHEQRTPAKRDRDQRRAADALTARYGI
jgi:hypothetical protein